MRTLCFYWSKVWSASWLAVTDWTLLYFNYRFARSSSSIVSSFYHSPVTSHHHTTLQEHLSSFLSTVLWLASIKSEGYLKHTDRPPDYLYYLQICQFYQGEHYSINKSNKIPIFPKQFYVFVSILLQILQISLVCWQCYCRSAIFPCLEQHYITSDISSGPSHWWEHYLLFTSNRLELFTYYHITISPDF